VVSSPTKETLSYVKRLPTPNEELNAIGVTSFEMFLAAIEPIYWKAVCETVNHLILCQGEYSCELKKRVGVTKFDKSKWNTYLQQQYGILKRHEFMVLSLTLKVK